MPKKMSGNLTGGSSRAGATGFRLASCLAFLWGWALGSGRVRRYGSLWVHSGLPTWGYARGGTCVGDCLLTTKPPGPALIKHEQAHVDQWRRYGSTFPIRYWLAGVKPELNRFEIEAGLSEGGYISTPSKKMR